MPATARQLRYGREAQFPLEVPPAVMAGTHYAPASIDDVAGAAATALAEPIDFPAFREAVVPGDRVVIALQPGVPSAAELIAAVWDVLVDRGVDPADVTILQPPRLDLRTEPDPRSALPEVAAEAISWRTHDALEESELAYLATSSSGERVYLAKALVDADLVLPIGLVEFDAVLGYQGTAGGLFPALSNLEAIKRHGAIAHAELTPDDSRTARVVADEVGWLLGVQFVLQAVRGSGSGLSHVMGGLSDAVFEEGKRLLRDGWRLELPQRADLVLASVDAGPVGTDWADLIRAADAASKLATRGGRVVLLSDLKAGPGSLSDALAIIRESATIEEAQQVLPALKSVDQPLAMRLLRVLSRCELFVLADVASELAEALFFNVVESEDEVRRLLATADRIAVLEGGQHLETRIAS